MASSKEAQHPARPIPQQRLSMSSNLSSSAPRSTHSRHHSHSVSSSSINPNHRVTRRKSVSVNQPNALAVAAAVREIGDSSFSIPMPTATSRRNTMSRPAGSKYAGLSTPPSSLPGHRLSSLIGNAHRKSGIDESAIEDDPNEDTEANSFNKQRNRRASEGQSTKGEGKKNDLRCDKCGKGYKHSSCLTKHLWEHTPEWSYTSKLLISKHQQVQLLEAASVLVAMNQDGPTPPPSAKDFSSDHDSASPAASGSSDPLDGLSSADTTPPPHAEQYNQSYTGSSYVGSNKRYSSGNNYSRSYQSAPYVSAGVSSIPNGSTFSSYRRQSNARPTSSGVSSGGQDDEAGLAAAVELLSCSFGTPRTGPVTLPADVPPVPPLPARYLSSNSGFSGITLTPIHQGSAPTSFLRGSRNDQRGRDVKMEESESEDEQRSRARSGDDDEDMFRME